jgi:hypothetical protein
MTGETPARRLGFRYDSPPSGSFVMAEMALGVKTRILECSDPGL